MDNLTHTLIGVTVANTGLKNKIGRGTIWALAISSNIPDLDVFIGFFRSDPSFMYRRMWTHSLVAWPLLSLGLAFLFHKIFQSVSWQKFFGACLLGSGLHVFFDLVNSYGVVLLHPFSHHRFELSWIFIIDLAIWGMLLLPLLLSILPPFRKWLIPLSRAAAVLLILYVGFCGLSRWRAHVLLRDQSATSNGRVLFTYVFPEALGPHRFHGIVRYPNSYHEFLIYPLTGEIKGSGLSLTEESSPEVQRILEQSAAKNIMWFFKAPVWRKENTPGDWSVSDLRFQSLVLKRKIPFRYYFHLD